MSIISTINDSFGDVTNPSKRCNHDYALVIDGTRLIELDAWTVGYETSISIDINGCLSLSFSESSAISTLQSGGKSQELQRGRPWTVEARVREVALHFCPTTDESPYILSVTNLVLRQQKNDSWESFLTLYGRNWNLTYEDERNRLVSGGSLNGISVDEDYSFTFNKR